MNNRIEVNWHRWLTILITIGAFSGALLAQPTAVSISGIPSSPTTAPTGSFTMTATATASGGTSITKVVFYRNDVPYETDTSSAYQFTQNLGQDTYTFRARAYDSAGLWADSVDYRLVVNTPRVFKMGDSIPQPSPSPAIPTSGPGRYTDHTVDVQNAINYLSSQGGGTLVFPCGDSLSIFNIKNTITIPSDITLQGESSEDVGRCRIYWHDTSWYPGEGCYDNPGTLLNKPMFKIVGGTSRVRFRDMFLYSRSSGSDCYLRYDWDRIDGEGTVAIEMTAPTSSGNISDVIFENITVDNFTYGIKAVSDSTTNNEISDIKIRGYKPGSNHRQLYIDSKYAYNWDVQNLNPSGMMQTQGGIEIVNAGRPGGYTGENGGLKFLQLNCNGNADRAYPPAFCIQVEKHSGLYFRQLHTEGVDEAIQVEDISSRSSNNTNDDPIVFEASVTSGKFYDASMKLYLIGNGLTGAPFTPNNGQDDGGLRFFGDGKDSVVVDCGDVHGDATDIQDDGDPYDTTTYDDLQMSYTHTERNRSSFFADDGAGGYFNKQHTICPSGVSGITNINEVGGRFFDNGVMPTEAAANNSKQYTNIINSTTCPSMDGDVCLSAALASGGAVYMDGTFTFDHTVTVPRGAQITGAPNSLLQFVSSGSTGSTDIALLRIEILILTSLNQNRSSGIVLRNLYLKTTESGLTGLEMMNENSADVGVASDYHFSGLKIEGFDQGIYAGRNPLAAGHPMIDGISMKNISLIDNTVAGLVMDSSNISNWNNMDLNIESDTGGANGWYQTYGGNQGFQDVTCKGVSGHPMVNCIRLQMSTAFINGLKPTQYVTNPLNIGESYTVYSGIYQGAVATSLVARNSDFSGGTVNLLGKSFITSMNNKYGSFSMGSTYGGNVSRVTNCADTYSGTPYNGLAATHQNLWIWVPTPTLTTCGTRPIPWEDVVQHGGASGDVPLVGNFYDDDKEDLVIYRPATSSSFLIKSADGASSQTIGWGTTGDIPLTAHFYPTTDRAQFMIFRPSSGQWWVKDPNNGSNDFVASWGTSGDVPFVGNFFNEAGGSISGNKDEIGIYRPGASPNPEFWIKNPRSGVAMTVFTSSAPNDSAVQVGDFTGLGRDQVALYKNGSWVIIDPLAATTPTTVSFGTTGDVPVAGKYLSGSCTQLGVWHPATQEFQVRNAVSGCGSTSTVSMVWGSNNDFLSTAYTDDIPLNITFDGTIRKPAAYRPTKGAFPASIANGQWLIHDKF